MNMGPEDGVFSCVTDTSRDSATVTHNTEDFEPFGVEPVRPLG